MAPKTLLLVEDSEADILFLKRAAAEIADMPSLQTVTDGAEALNYLTAKGRFTDRTAYPFPDLMLLDLKLPKKSGLEVLEWMKEHQLLAPRVIVLTSSSEPEDIRRSYELGAVAYIEKPLTSGLLKRIVAAVAAYCNNPDSRIESLSWYIRPFP